MVLWPASPYAVLDFDGPHAEAAWQSTNIELPETARNITRSGGQHLYFRMPGEAPELKRNVRLVKASCECAKICGVDLLVNGTQFYHQHQAITKMPIVRLNMPLSFRLKFLR